MLVLTRLKDQKIVIGKDVEITVVSCDDGRVKLGIDAPKSIQIVRKELLDNHEYINNEAAKYERIHNNEVR